jgi:hypothetical protein
MKYAAWGATGLLVTAVLLRLCLASEPPAIRPLSSPTAPQSEWNEYAAAVEKRGGTVEQSLAGDPARRQWLEQPAVQERLRIVKQTRDERLREAREKLERSAEEQNAQAAENVRRQRERLKAAGIDPDAPAENIVGPK